MIQLPEVNTAKLATPKLSVMVKFERVSGLWNCRLIRPTGTFFPFFPFFFQNPKKHDLLRLFELPHTFSRTLIKKFKVDWFGGIYTDIPPRRYGPGELIAYYCRSVVRWCKCADNGAMFHQTPETHVPPHHSQHFRSFPRNVQTAPAYNCNLVSIIHRRRFLRLHVTGACWQTGCLPHSAAGLN